MRRSTSIWLFFCLLLLIVISAMGWISFTLIKLDNQNIQSQRFAETEENIRLALWRMDAGLGPLVAQEDARPWYTYSPFYPPPQAYARMYAPLQPGDVLLPSPLLTTHNPFILLHFQYDSDGNLTSPQVPTGNMQDIAEMRGLTKVQINRAKKKDERFFQTRHTR